MKGLICYQTTTGEYQFYRQATKSFTANRQQASVWPKLNQAQQALDKLAHKNLPPAVKQVLPQLKVMDAEQDFIRIVPSREINKYLAMDVNQLAGVIREHADFFIVMLQVQAELQRQLNHYDGDELQDLLHTIELSNPSDGQSLALQSALQTSRRQRRSCKDRLQLLTTFQMNGGYLITSQTLDMLDGVKETLQQSRTYQYRTKNIQAEFGNLLNESSEMEMTSLTTKSWWERWGQMIKNNWFKLKE